ncbi:MAG: tRNA (adenosine(37)-N6)-threonylcarbamoyltransferase complex ATPase subunit type 1 TsaE [Proteobacteria bacterium]|nr:tRNA (adenosine(37)-N6)-threonylcarbamoyltransferase complex ATPase subunit type 1 TsaE [Pseudomonadota bacterium]
MALAIESPALELELADEAATARLAGRLARLAGRGDVIALRGELGAGKTAFARAFIAALAARAGLAPPEVPSPTFTLVQGYTLGEVEVWHFDLYRLGRPEEAFDLGIEEAFAGAISLIEWPERLGPLLPEARLEVELRFAGAPSARRVRLSGDGGWGARLDGLSGRA